MKYLTIIVSFIALSFGCNENSNRGMLVEAEVYYQIFDKLFKTSPDIRRFILRIPIEINNRKIMDNSQLILCYKYSDGVLHFNRIFDGVKNNKEFLLEVKVLIYENDTLTVEPLFSPIEVNKELYKQLNYKKGQTKIVQISLIADNNSCKASVGNGIF